MYPTDDSFYKKENWCLVSVGVVGVMENDGVMV